ncbi:MAG: permease [Candidatus Nanohaloarchaea archaeon]|nr:permease [Candidatus Nanohaloarchaea archaeon]
MKRWEYFILGNIALIAIAAGLFSATEPVLSYLIGTGLEAARLALIMAWETWWALVLGFTIAGAVEAWISTDRISEHLGGAGPKELALASFFGFVSSSCSFSAVATAKNIFKKGGSAAASLGGFMFASTNLVIEIGLVMWILLGWQFVVADFIGGIILIALMGFGLRYLVPDQVIEEARQSVIGREGNTAEDPVCGMDVPIEDAEHTQEHDGKTYYFCSQDCLESFNPGEHEAKSLREHATSLEGWQSLAQHQWKEWTMLYEDILVGFVLAGIIGAFVPTSVWTALFSGQQFFLPAFVLWAAALGAIIGVATFVCSVGNVPFAAILWNNGLPFGSVLSYIYADLIVPPIMDAYRKYYGTQFALLLSGLIFTTAVITGFIIHFLFLTTGFIPTGSAMVVDRSIELNYKAVLNSLFTLVFIGLFLLRREPDHEHE